MSSLLVSIVLHDTKKIVIDNCIFSITNQKIQNHSFTTEIIVNNEQYDTADLEQKYKNVKFYRIENRGFGNAHNKSIMKSKNYDYHLVLNPDTKLKDNVFKLCINYMNNNPKIALLSPKIFLLKSDKIIGIQKSLRNYPKFFTLIFRRFMPNSYITKLYNKKHEIFPGNHVINNVPVVSGAFMFFKSDILKKIGGFDERFFMYMEDVDICLRIKNYGSITYFPDAHIYHHFEKGSSKNFKLFFIHVKSYIIYLIKYFKFN